MSSLVLRTSCCTGSTAPETPSRSGLVPGKPETRNVRSAPLGAGVWAAAQMCLEWIHMSWKGTGGARAVQPRKGGSELAAARAHGAHGAHERSSARPHARGSGLNGRTAWIRGLSWARARERARGRSHGGSPTRSERSARPIMGRRWRTCEASAAPPCCRWAPREPEGTVFSQAAWRNREAWFGGSDGLRGGRMGGHFWRVTLRPHRAILRMVSKQLGDHRHWDEPLANAAFFPKQFTVRGSQCFKEWSPWCWMVWPGSWLACLQLAFICLPVLFICLPFLFICLPDCCLWSGSRLACLPHPFMCLPLLFICLPVLFICLPGWVLVVGFLAGLSPTSFHLSPSSFHLSPRVGACGRVPGWLVSHFLSFVSQFFSFVSQAGCLWSGSRLACLPLPFICLPVLFICLPGWVLVVRFQAGLSPTSFHLSPNSFHLFPRLVACGRVPGWLVSHFLSCVPHFFSFVFQFLSFVSQAGCLRSGSRLACLQLAFICLPVLFICGCLWSGSRLACLPHPFMCLPVLFICLPLLFICLPGWVL